MGHFKVSLGGGASGDDAVALGDGFGEIWRGLLPFAVSPIIHLRY